MKYYKHLIGLVILAFGIIGIVRAKLGAAPIDAFNYFLYRLLEKNGINVTLGTIVFSVGTFSTLLTYILTKDKTLLVSFGLLFVLSVFIDGWDLLFGLIPEVVIGHLGFRIPLVIFSFMIVNVGVAMTMSTGLPTMPYERLLVHIDQNINNLSISKIFIDGTFLILAIILGLYLDILFEQVFIMTVVIAFFTGFFVKRFLKVIQKIEQKGVIVSETK